MAKKGTQIVLQEEINTNDDWAKMLGKPGVYVIDVYAECFGPSLPMISNLKRIKLELANNNLHFAIAKSDNITALERFRQKSEPHWMFLFDGKLVNLIIDSNAPRLIKMITDVVEEYGKYKRGEIQKQFLPMNIITAEERRKMIEYEQYQKQKWKKGMKIRDDTMMKVRERNLKQFLENVQMQTCVVFFPHTVSYIMVEKPPEEGAEETAEPVMVKKRVCEVANSCALKYEELIVVEAKEIQLTEVTLNEVFFKDKNVLESFPQSLIDDLLSRKVYSVMLSLPTVKQDEPDEETATEETPPDPVEMLCKIIYGNGDPLNPSPDSLADEHMIVNNAGEDTPSLYTPTNPLSKASALTVLFRKFCLNLGYVAPQPPSPQYLIIFEINKSNIVLPIIEDLEDKIVNYGFFRSADPENPRLLCKDPELLITYGMDKVGKDAKLVLSVVSDDRDKSMLKFVDAGPIYVSQDSETGIDDAINFFPHDYDQMDGEVKHWLSQPDEDGAGAEEGSGYAEDGGEEEFDTEGEEEQAADGSRSAIA